MSVVLALLLPLLQMMPSIIAAAQTLRGSADLTADQRAQIDAALEAANNALQAA